MSIVSFIKVGGRTGSGMDKEAQITAEQAIYNLSVYLQTNGQTIPPAFRSSLKYCLRLLTEGKLPEGEPPLLSDEQLIELRKSCESPIFKAGQEPDGETAFIAVDTARLYRTITQAQYNSIMEHLGLPFRV